MEGLMQKEGLTIHTIFERSEFLYGDKTIVSYFEDGSCFTYSFRDFQARVKQLANLLTSLGVRAGDRVATFGFNHHHHLELYLAVPMIGAVLHPLNVRLHEEQLVWIANHAEDSLLFYDCASEPIISRLRPHLKTVRRYVRMGLVGTYQNPEATPHVDELLSRHSPTFQFPQLDENTAASLAYTSGTTGAPKGVVYSHRSVTLATWSLTLSVRLTDADTLALLVPLCHAGAWNYPFVCLLAGVDLVLPGRDLTPPVIVRHLLRHHVTFTSAVPTVWLGVLDELRRRRGEGDPLLSSPLSHLRLTTGGSACPPSLIESFQREFGVSLTQMWGMTETSPLGTMSTVKHALRHTDEPGKLNLPLRAKQGWPLVGVRMRVVDAQGNPLPRDGGSVGELQVRGPFIIRAYFKGVGEESFTADGWFRTGDLGHIDDHGYLRLVDRAKDVIKSGGEWISSVDVENALMAHPKVAEAAVIGVEHPKFMERPVALVVLRQPSSSSPPSPASPSPSPSSPTRSPSSSSSSSTSSSSSHVQLRAELTRHLASRVARWWLPDAIIFVDSIPKTSVGKFDKKVLRERYKDALLTPATSKL